MTIPDKIPPQALDAEESVLGVCLSDRSVDRVADHVRPEEFYRSAYGEIFAAMLECDKQGIALDVRAVQSVLQARGTFEDCGGFSTLSSLTFENMGSVTPSNGPYYAGRVRQAAQRRALMTAAMEIYVAAQDEEAETEDVIARAEQSLTEAIDRDVVDETCVDGQLLADAVLERMEQDFKRGGRERGMYTGLPDLDYVLGGLSAGELIIIAARTSMGKTALALSIMRNIILIGRRVIYFSLEMPRDNIMDRLYAMEGKVPMNRLMNGTLTRDDLEASRKARRRFDGCKFLVDDRAGVSPEYIRRKVRRENARAPLSCVFVDHLHLMRTGLKFDKMVEKWGEISQQLKILARDLKIPVVALAQFSRGPESRTDKTPQMSDLRESGRLEEDADKIVSIFRPSYYKPGDATEEKTAPDDDVRLHVVKNRNGKTGSVPIRFHEETGFFESIVKDYQPVAPARNATTAQPAISQSSTQPDVFADDFVDDTPTPAAELERWYSR